MDACRGMATVEPAVHETQQGRGGQFQGALWIPVDVVTEGNPLEYRQEKPALGTESADLYLLFAAGSFRLSQPSRNERHTVYQ